MSEGIDFVITWVDGNDLEWQKDKNSYSNKIKSDDRIKRYRDWNILHFWFRGVEKYAPWVRKIHFVTCGHIPDWLNQENPKLNVVKHEDFIPHKYLPTFNSRTIDLNLHRIEGLSEKFVYFNDDMFIIKDVKEKDFFKKNLPCDTLVLNALCFSKEPSEKDFSKSFIAAMFNMMLINSNFSKKQVVKSNFKKWFSFKYKFLCFRSLLLMPWNKFTGFMNYHLPYSYLKETYRNVWKLEPEILDKTCIGKFRDNTDVNNWLFSYWQYASGTFTPRSPNIGKYFPLDFDNKKNKEIYSAIENQKYKLLCINDTVDSLDEDVIKKELKQSFSKILPEKSNFEN